MSLALLLKYRGTIHLRKAVCTDHVDFPMLFAELQYLAALFSPKKDSSCFKLGFFYSKNRSHCYL